jgi:hypothetical protein
MSPAKGGASVSSLIEEARQYQARPNGPPCTMRLLLESLSPEHRAEAVEALASDVQTTALREAMVARGWEPPKIHTMNRHRKGECSCG